MNLKKLHTTAAAAAAISLIALTASQAGAQQTDPVFCDGVEATIVGTESNDNIFGTDGDDVIVALGGHDKVFAGDGDDLICGGEGNDLLFGNLGTDTIFGNKGQDLIAGNWDSENSVVPQDLVLDSGPVYAYGGPGSDTIIGTNRSDVLVGGAGSDKILGYNGHDVLKGGKGRDILAGHKGDDALIAGKGEDILSGDRDDVKLKAGGGFDHCASVTNTAATWVSCEGTYVTSNADPLLPADPLPSQLSGGSDNVYVHTGKDGSRNSIVFLVDGNQLQIAGADFELENAANSNIIARDSAHILPVTEGEAKAIGEALRIRRGKTNWDSTLDPNASYYADAVAWGNRWIQLNTDE